MLEAARDAGAGAAVRAPLVISRPASSTDPSSGKSKPVITFTRVDLPAPFGPDQSDDLVPVQLERDLLQGLDALEGP